MLIRLVRVGLDERCFERSTAGVRRAIAREGLDDVSGFARWATVSDRRSAGSIPASRVSPVRPVRAARVPLLASLLVRDYSRSRRPRTRLRNAAMPHLLRAHGRRGTNDIGYPLTTFSRTSVESCERYALPAMSDTNAQPVGAARRDGPGLSGRRLTAPRRSEWVVSFSSRWLHAS